MLLECFSTSCLALFFCLLVVVPLAIGWFLLGVWKRNRYPPGPLQLPLIGNSYIFHCGLSTAKLAKTLQKTYGNVVSLSFGSFFKPDAVLLSGVDTIRQVMEVKDEFAQPPVDRPNTAHKNNAGLTWAKFTEAREMRKCFSKLLNSFGVFNGEAIEKIGDEYLTDFLRSVDDRLGRPWNPRQQLALSIGGIMHVLLFGRRPSNGENESYMTDFLRLGDKITENSFFDMFGLPLLPFVSRFVPKEDCAPDELLYVQMKALILCEIQRRRRFDNFHLTEQLSSPTKFGTKLDYKTLDFIECYLAKENSGKPVPLEQFSRTLGDLFLAQMMTVPDQILWAFYFLAKMPDEQDRLYSEINSAVPADRSPNRLDTFRLIRVEAFLQETYRFSSLIPVIPLHEATRDLEVCGFRIPAGTLVWYSIYSCHFDRQRWGDPENFRVERWLSSDGTELSDNCCDTSNIVSFGIGNRSCPGEILGRSQVFAYVVGVVRNYKIKLMAASPGSNDVANYGGEGLIRRVNPKVTFTFTKR